MSVSSVPIYERIQILGKNLPVRKVVSLGKMYGMDDFQCHILLSSPGRSSGRAIVLPPASALALVSALAKC